MEQNKDLSTAQLFHLCQKLAAMKTPTQPSRGLPATPDEAAARSNYQPSPLGESRPARTYGTDPLVMHVLLPVAQNKRRWYRVCEHSERTQLQSAVGEKQAPLLECYAFWRYLLSVLVAHHARGDFKLVAVRLSSQAAVAQWLNWGGKSSTDSDGSLTIELDGLTAEGKQALVREGALQHVAEGFWDFRGNTGGESHGSGNLACTRLTPLTHLFAQTSARSTARTFGPRRFSPHIPTRPRRRTRGAVPGSIGMTIGPF